MPILEKRGYEGHLHTSISILPGEKIILYRSMKSKTFPFYEGTHKTLEDNPA